MSETNARQNLVRRIKALLAKTIENGATEAEAMSALAKAQEMMRAHGLDRDAIEAEAFIRDAFRKQASRGFCWVKDLGYAVGMFTGTFGWTRGPNTMEFAGRESDVIFASWLIDSLDGFVNRQALAYINSVGGARVQGSRSRYELRGPDLFGGAAPVVYQKETSWNREQKMRDFGMGVATRISQRLLELADTEAKIRRERALRKLKEQGMAFQKGRRPEGPRDGAAFEAGQRAGDGAAFNRPMGGSRVTAPRQIAHS